MLEVQIENIIPVTEARDRFNQLVDKVEGTDDLFVMTKNGKPAAILVGVHHLEKLTGENHTETFGMAPDAAAQTAETPAPAEATPEITTPVVETNPTADANMAATPIVADAMPVAPIEPVVDAQAVPPSDPAIIGVADTPAAPAVDLSASALPPIETPEPLVAPQPLENPVTGVEEQPADAIAAAAPATNTVASLDPTETTEVDSANSNPFDLPTDDTIQANPAPVTAAPVVDDASGNPVTSAANAATNTQNSGNVQL